jgi:limonene 1,2-monooxygenase
VHIAETRAEALEDIREGGARHLLEYVEATTGRPCPVPGPPERIVEQMAERGAWVVGTPDDLVEVIQRLAEVSGGFGTLLLWGHEWARTPAVHRSYELIARYVMPRVQGSLAGIEESNRVARAKAAETHALRTAATRRATEAAASSPNGRTGTREGTASPSA